MLMSSGQARHAHGPDETGNGKAPFPHLGQIAHSGSRDGREESGA